MAAETITGEVEKVEFRQEKPWDGGYNRYAPNNEYYDIYLDIVLRTDDGKRVYLKTPRGKMSVANCPIAAIVTYDVHPCRGFIGETGGSGVATREKANENQAVSLIKNGQRITVRGSVERKTSKAGNEYLTMKRVKLIG